MSHPKRVVLYFDPVDFAVTRCVLETHGYIVFVATSQRECEQIIDNAPIELLIVGDRAQFEPTREVKVVFWHRRRVIAEILEEIRLALVRKRGPKPNGRAEAIA